MNRSEQYVLDAIAELEAEDRDDISELVRWQLEDGWKRESDKAILRHGITLTISISATAPEEFDRWRARIDELRRLASPPIAEDAPYREHRKLEPGELAGWEDENGRVYVGVVREHVEDPPGSGNWTLTFEDESG